MQAVKMDIERRVEAVTWFLLAAHRQMHEEKINWEKDR